IVPHPGMSPPVVSRTPWHYNESASTESGREILAQQVPPVVNVRQNLATGTSVTGQAAVSHAAGDPEEQVRRNPDDAVAWVNLGNRRQDQNRQEEALQCYERAVAANPSLPAARQNLGYILFNLGFPERARDAYRDLLVLNPAPMNRLLAASVLPIIYQSSEDLQRWRQSQQENLQKIVNDGVTVDAAGQLVPTTFFWAYQGQNDREIMRLRGKILRGHNAAAVHERTHSAVSDSTTGRPIRVGFLSAYFRNHTIGRLNLGRIEKLDRSKFHVTVCSASTASDDFSARFKKAADQYVLVPRDVRSAIRVISDLKLDLLIWTDVGMDALCSTLAFSRMAPVQCATWGHPDTTGSESIDYFLSSETLDDETARDHYTETLIRMPLSGTWYERPAIPAGAEELPARLSLPAGKHYYTCPQTLFKFHPDDDAVLRGILEADPEGVVILIDGRLREWTRRLRARWDKTLADLQSRIHFVPALEHDDYLRLLRISHVILDPLHFGGGNSSYEAIAMGTPIVTRPGMFLRSRITASLYRRMQFSECIVRTVDEFVKLAVQIGSDPAYRERLRNEIDSRSSILFEQPEEIRCLEDTLIQCASRKC
ncbi:MAG: tetratricopeptide repeat protein, partial [Planctomyces sp.]